MKEQAGSVVGRELYSVDDTMLALGLGRTVVYELMGSGALESVKIGARRLVPRDAIRAYVERLRTEQADAAR